MFQEFEIRHRQLIFMGLKKLIEDGYGEGFHNGDLGHPVYRLGAENKEPGYDADSPEKNDLYMMLSWLSEDFKAREDSRYNWFYDFSSWQNFCKFVIQCYDSKI